ncbi:phage terminase large subunit family protein [Labrys sp. WJW]|uniref:phage terminase large subunit family protein n=1 Tax=Labrys sp. WJW TaxID=1737983 RepID=UPI001FD8ADC6|nr:phage terminase large subunit family protein [Labrys sp. WJW]
MLESQQPDPPYTVSEWADEHRYLSSKGSAEPGKWRTARTPYLREIMDNQSSYSTVEQTVVMKGAQIGMSEAGFNLVGYCIHHSPAPALYVMPTDKMVKRFSKARLDPMIADSPALSERIGPARSRDSSNTMFEKEYPGGILILTGANSASALRSMSIRYLILDEVDAYPLNVDQEGDPVWLAIKRTANFVRRKIFMLSTPGVAGFSRIGKAFREGDQRYFNVPCDNCGEMQPFTWKQIKWPKGRPDLAQFRCKFCDHPHAEHRKSPLMAKGEWIPTAESTRPGLRSYHISSLYSPWQSWADCARDFQACHGDDGRPDPALLQVFVNTVLGEEWEEAVERVDSEGLVKLVEDWGNEVPVRIAVITGGVDVQPDRLEAEIVGWGAGEESWSLEYRVLPGDPEEDGVWEDLDELLQSSWPHLGYEEGMRLQAACVDTGGSNTSRVYAYCDKRTRRKIWAIKGSNQFHAKIWPRKASRSKKTGSSFYMVGVSAAKDTIHKRLKRVGATASGAGACHFPRNRDAAYFDQLTAEVIRTKFRNGFPQKYWWKEDGKRNEALDCRVYAYAALHGLYSMGLKLDQQAAKVAERVAKAERDGRTPQQPESTADVSTPEPVPAPIPAPKASKSRGRRVVRSTYM